MAEPSGIDAPDCRAAADLDWSFNSLNQSPCLVAAILRGVCYENTFSFDSIGPDDDYGGPVGDGDTDICSCSTVAYNMMSACGACQGAEWTTWSYWSLECPFVAPDGQFPKAIPTWTKVPHWAFQMVYESDVWDLELAMNTGDTPESGYTTSSSVFSTLPKTTVPIPTTPSSVFPTIFSTATTSTAATTSTVATISTVATTSTTATTSTSATRSTATRSIASTESTAVTGSSAAATTSVGLLRSHSSNPGPIAGGTIGGIFGVALIIVGVAWCLLRRRRRHHHRIHRTSQVSIRPPGPQQSSQGTETQSVGHFIPKRYYNPSSPNTLPQPEGDEGISRYKGLPEPSI